MKIGIDISQTAYEKTGVASYLTHLLTSLLSLDNTNEYVFFYSSLRRQLPASMQLLIQEHSDKVRLKVFKIPPRGLDFLWNKLHTFPVENFIGDVDVFISSDWTQPPTWKAKKTTILYDLIVYKSPKETDVKIVQTQKRRLKWVKKECDAVLCISESTKRDAIEILGIQPERLSVVYPGI